MFRVSAAVALNFGISPELTTPQPQVFESEIPRVAREIPLNLHRVTLSSVTLWPAEPPSLKPQILRSVYVFFVRFRKKAHCCCCDSRAACDQPWNDPGPASQHAWTASRRARPPLVSNSVLLMRSLSNISTLELFRSRSCRMDTHYFPVLVGPFCAYAPG